MNSIVRSTLGASVILCVACTLANAEAPYDAVAQFDPSIPTPESVTGHATGQRPVRYHMLVSYLNQLTQASDRVLLSTYGTTHEGRKLYYLTVTSAANHQKLMQISATNAKLADPRKLTDNDDIEQIIAQQPAVAWMAYNIHGDELSSTDAAMAIAYRLAAGQDKKITKLLDEVVILIDPLQNPDGRERFLAQMEQLSGVVPSSDYQAMQHRGLWGAGRGNHYFFDMNRDWLTQNHEETRGRAAAILSWHPQLLVDSHEMGGLNTYLFDPPSEPTNLHLGPKNLAWRRRFSADQAQAFNQHGWSYYTREWYTDWGPFYTNAWANLLGATGILYEQSGTNGSLVKQQTGHETTFTEAIHHQITSSFANLETLRQHRREILRDFTADRQWAVSDQGPYNRTFLLPPAPDHSRFQTMVNLLNAHGIEVEFARESFKAHDAEGIWGDKHDSIALPAGTCIVHPAQPHRRMRNALLEFDPRLPDAYLQYERTELQRHRGTHMYDVSTWNLSMTFGLEAYWAEGLAEVRTTAEAVNHNKASALPVTEPKYGWLIDASTSDVYPALVKLFDNDCQVRVATQPFTVSNLDFGRGTLLLRRHENPDSVARILKYLAVTLDVTIHSVDTALVQTGPDLGGPRMVLLTQPRTAIASQWPISSTSFGALWYVLDYKITLRTSPLNIQNLGRTDLRKYNVLILPTSRSLKSVLDEAAVKKIKQWVESGGTLIAVGSSAAFVANRESPLSTVRLKRDALEELTVYAEDLQQEKAARSVTIDPAEIWQGKKTSEPTGHTEPEKKTEKSDIDTLKRNDQWKRMFSPSGVFLTGVTDQEHWLTFGLEDKLPLLFSGDAVFMSKHPIATAVRMDSAEELRMSGLLWPEARERIADSAYATTEKLGNGQVILFAADPTFRAWLGASERLLLNAVLLGPGMGTSAPVPW